MSKKLGIIIFLGLIVCSYFFYNYNNKSGRLYDGEYLKPYLFSFGVDETLYKEMVENKYIDPLGTSTTAISYFYKGVKNNDDELIKKALNIVAILENYPYKRTIGNSTLYMYENAHENWKGKTWWSGMSNATIALAYLMAYDITKEDKYKDYSLSALNGVTNNIKDNGSAIELDKKSTWYLEYASDDSSSENSRFVLNGFTYALISINLIGEYLESEKILTDYKKGMNAFKKFRNKFYDSSNYIYYMLNPKNIESMHYAVFDLLLIKTLAYKENNDSILKDEIKNRENIFKKHFGIEKNNEGLTYFSSVGIPYPYWIDIYKGRIVVEYNDDTKEIIPFSPLDMSKDISKRIFKNISCCSKSNIKNMKIYQEKSGVEFLLFTIKPEEIIEVENMKIVDGKEIIKESHVLRGGSKINDFSYKTKEMSSELRIQYLFSKPIKLKENKFFSINYNIDGKLNSIYIILIDEKDKAISSYYPLKKDNSKNSIVLSPLSFLNYDKSLAIKELRLYLGIESFKQSNKITIENIKFNINRYELTNSIISNDIFDETSISIPFKD